MSFQKYKNNYRNGDCIHKKSCRYILLGLLDDLKLRRVKSLTLPSTNFYLESKLVEKYRFHHVSTCEINPKIYDEQVKMLSYSELEDYYMYNRDVFEIKGRENLNFIWLDLCGYLTADLYMKLFLFIANNTFAKEGIFAITLLSARENSNAKGFFKQLQYNTLGTKMRTLKNFRSVQFPKILKHDLELSTNMSFELVSNYSYSPTSGAGLMTMYAFKWTRESNR